MTTRTQQQYSTHEVSHQPADKVKEDDGDLEGHACRDDRRRHLRSPPGTSRVKKQPAGVKESKRRFSSTTRVVPKQSRCGQPRAETGRVRPTLLYACSTHHEAPPLPRTRPDTASRTRHTSSPFPKDGILHAARARRKHPPTKNTREPTIPLARIIHLFHTCATAEATKKHVASTPATGVTGRTALTAFGKNLLVIMPTTMGASTTCVRIDPIRTKPRR